MRSRFWKLTALIPIIVLSPVVCGAETRVEMQQTGIDAKQAESIQKTLRAAASAYGELFGFDLPDALHCSVTVGPGQPTSLYTDGNDHVFLALPSKDKLARPEKSGVWNLYGLCHELGHDAMYRLLKDRDWLSSVGAEGWAHYAGSVVVDRVYEVEGEGLWWDPYDYRADGTARLRHQMERAQGPNRVDRAAMAWMALEKLIGRREFPRVFAAWQEAKIDPAKPEALLTTLQGLYPEKKGELAKWWASASPLLVLPPPKASGFAAAHVKPAELSGKPTLLPAEPPKPGGKKSIAGSGHARLFQAPGPGRWYLRAVLVYGARYGRLQPPNRDFELSLCDKDLRPVASWKVPYAKFKRGEGEWVRLEVEPTLVPDEFAACVAFQPNATEGVYVWFDGTSTGHSKTGTPGKEGAPFKQGDWLIRVELDRLKSADALTGP